MKIEVDVTGDNEATAYPWWAIVDPAQNMRADLAHAAGQITGPFFSRAEAEGFLKATRYNFGKRAKVWCFSGTYSHQYREAFRAAEAKERAKEPPKECEVCGTTNGIHNADDHREHNETWAKP